MSGEEEPSATTRRLRRPWRAIEGVSREAERIMLGAGEIARAEGASPEMARQVCVVLDEVLSNVTKHGGGDTTPVTVGLIGRKRGLVVQVTDRGLPFDPTSPANRWRRPPPDTPGGLGLRLIARLVTHARYRRLDDRNEVTLWFDWRR